MPIYEYICRENQQKVEVLHDYKTKITTWGELCQLAGLDLGDTPAETSVVRTISSPSLAFPKTNSELKNLGFTKLVKRDTGVYENVTATNQEKRYMTPDDPSSMPDLKKKISD